MRNFIINFFQEHKYQVKLLSLEFFKILYIKLMKDLKVENLMIKKEEEMFEKEPMKSELMIIMEHYEMVDSNESLIYLKIAEILKLLIIGDILK